MSVLDEETIDFAGVNKDDNNLTLTIVDHLEWGVEADDVHLLMLQNKINAYLHFIESKEIDEHFDSEKYNEIIIRLTAKYPFSEECLKFLNMAKPVVEESGFFLEWEISQES